MTNADTEIELSVRGPRLSALVDLINDSHLEVLRGLRTTLRAAAHTGELLTQARRQLPHGAWTPWVEANLQFSERTARRYMQTFRQWPEIGARINDPDVIETLGLRDTLSSLGSPVVASCDERPFKEHITARVLEKAAEELAWLKQQPDLGRQELFEQLADLLSWGLAALERIDWDVQPRAAELYGRLKRLDEQALAAQMTRIRALDEATFEREAAEMEAREKVHTVWSFFYCALGLPDREPGDDQ